MDDIKRDHCYIPQKKCLCTRTITNMGMAQHFEVVANKLS